MNRPFSARRAAEAGNDPANSEHGRQGLSRRQFSAALAALAGVVPLGWPNFIESANADEFFLPSPITTPTISYPLYDEAVSRVLPNSGFQSRIALRDSIIKLVEYGVIDRGKFFALSRQQGGAPSELERVLSDRSDLPILLKASNATYYVNLLWPVGLAAHMTANAESKLNGDGLNNFASTGGWTLGREENGGAYFNKFPIVELTRDGEARVVSIANATYRPCCNNSTFFQDCNHGSALLGLLQLGVSQGLSENELYREALAFNSFWFADYYVRTALFFKVVEKVEWTNVNAKIVLGFDYSAGGPWQQNVATQVEAIPGLIPPPRGGGASCGV